ncbi:EamA family transporter [Candidatus Bathyarchaeota archaeon]|nr:EamA family transporter [Candidatus Bathyarchaeota archaeon]
MAGPILLAVVSMLLTGTSDFLYKRVRMRAADPENFLAYQAVFFNATSLTYTLYSGSLEVNVLTLIFGFGCAVLAYSSVLLFLAGLGGGQASVNVPVFRLSFIVTAVLAFIFLGESATAGKIVATALATFSILILSKGLVFQSIPQSRVLKLILATLNYGLFGFLYKVAVMSGCTPTGILVVQGLFFISLAFAMASFKGALKLSSTVMVHAPACGVMLSSAFLLLLESLRGGDVSVNFSIVQLSFVVTSILAVAVWRERVDTVNILGIVSAVLAVIFFAYL